MKYLWKENLSTEVATVKLRSMLSIYPIEYLFSKGLSMEIEHLENVNEPLSALPLNQSRRARCAWDQTLCFPSFLTTPHRARASEKGQKMHPKILLNTPILTRKNGMAHSEQHI